eukprot:SAG31_NODE_14691_length_792_cov_1.574315_1_plen_215_part_00
MYVIWPHILNETVWVLLGATQFDCVQLEPGIELRCARSLRPQKKKKRCNSSQVVYSQSSCRLTDMSMLLHRLRTAEPKWQPRTRPPASPCLPPLSVLPALAAGGLLFLGAALPGRVFWGYVQVKNPCLSPWHSHSSSTDLVSTPVHHSLRLSDPFFGGTDRRQTVQALKAGQLHQPQGADSRRPEGKGCYYTYSGFLCATSREVRDFKSREIRR